MVGIAACGKFFTQMSPGHKCPATLASYEEHQVQYVLRFTRYVWLPFHFLIAAWLTVSQDAETSRGMLRIIHGWIIFGWFASAIWAMHVMPQMQRHRNFIIFSMLFYGLLWELATRQRFELVFGMFLDDDEPPPSDMCIVQLSDSESFSMMVAYTYIALGAHCQALPPRWFYLLVTASILSYVLQLRFLGTEECPVGCLAVTLIFVTLCTLAALGVRWSDESLRSSYTERENERSELMQVIQQAAAPIAIFKKKQGSLKQRQQSQIASSLHSVLGVQTWEKAGAASQESTDSTQEADEELEIEVWNAELAHITQTCVAEGTDWVDVECLNSMPHGAQKELRAAVMLALSSSQKRPPRMILPFMCQFGVKWFQLDVWPLHKNDGFKVIMFASDVTEFVKQHPSLLRHTHSRLVPETDTAARCSTMVAEIQPADYVLRQCSAQFNIFFLRRMHQENLLSYVAPEDKEQVVDAVQNVACGHGAQQISISFLDAHGTRNNSVVDNHILKSSPRLEHSLTEDEDEGKVWLKFSRHDQDQVEQHSLVASSSSSSSVCGSAQDAIAVEIMHAPKHHHMGRSYSDTLPHTPCDVFAKTRSVPRRVGRCRFGKDTHTFDNGQFHNSLPNPSEMRRSELSRFPSHDVECSILTPTGSASSYDSVINHKVVDGIIQPTGQNLQGKASSRLSGVLRWRSSSMHDSERGTIVSEPCEELMIETLDASSVEEQICNAVASWGKEVDSEGPRHVVARGLELFAKHAKGGALMAVVPREETGVLEKFTRTADGRYLTTKLRKVHILSEEFKQIFITCTDHSSEECDRWPTTWPDEEGRNQPKDGAMLVSTTGFRLMCAAKLVGLPKAYYQWPKGVGTRHETALQLACYLQKSIVFVRSDSGSLHVFSVSTIGDHKQMRVYRVDDPSPSLGTGSWSGEARSVFPTRHTSSSEPCRPDLPHDQSSSSKTQSSDPACTPALWHSVYKLSSGLATSGSMGSQDTPAQASTSTRFAL